MMSNRAKFSACSARTKLITVQMISVNWAHVTAIIVCSVSSPPLAVSPHADGNLIQVGLYVYLSKSSLTRTPTSPVLRLDTDLDVVVHVA